MGDQKQKGNAFEYACLTAFYEELKSFQNVEIQNSNAVSKAKESFNQISHDEQEKNKKAAKAAFNVILKLEPQLNKSINNPLFLTIQEDSEGQLGDVRDVLCLRVQNKWEIGISCKHNHNAVKHSRLSDVLDFGYKWFGVKCSSVYFENIRPIFNELRQMRKEKMLWRNLENKEDRFYKTILDEFIKELKFIDENNDDIPCELLKYLLGRNDFYKVIMRERKKVTHVQGFNVSGTLNQSLGNIKPKLKVNRLKYPERFIEIRYKKNSKSTIIITCDNGWAISMRIHNASSKIEPSLKFDVQLISVPPELYSHFEPWE